MKTMHSLTINNEPGRSLSNSIVRYHLTAILPFIIREDFSNCQSGHLVFVNLLEVGIRFNQFVAMEPGDCGIIWGWDSASEDGFVAIF